ncbi:DUF3500 domain-containing protein [Rhizobium etli]|uniref:DUF3500 domain-containing protein n=1 Tax=Rhizobium etli TaxID=29449 RepID=A0A7W6VBP6_RHIET|nr:DUF3500 domain-containing protein [Rhizobium etli]MBB4481260.1 hypothetical protein [Rhizobium etli]MBB4537127.1 hypothetical protein [Rhizobium etli]
MRGSTSASSDATRKAFRTVLDRANGFIATLSDNQRSALLQPYTFANASRWHTYPQWYLGRRGRIGLRLETLSKTQWSALNALLAAATGSGKNEGYDEIQQHLKADDHLRQMGKGDGYGRGDFYVAFLGTPSETGLWQLQFGGHHLALTNTYRDGTLIGATPSFRGIEPAFPFEYNNITYAPQRHEMDAFRALLASLDEGQLAQAKLSRSFADVIMRPGKDWSFPKRAEGIPASSLNSQQRALLCAVIAIYVSDIDDAIAELIMARYERELEATHISYSGSTSLSRERDYVRIDGPSVWIEFVMDAPYNFSAAASAWRLARQEYGLWRDSPLDHDEIRRCSRIVLLRAPDRERA